MADKPGGSKKQKNIIPTIEGLGTDSMAVFNGMGDKSDRDVALALAAYIDDALHAMYRRLLLDEGKPNGTFIQSLLKGYGPLSNLSARIDMAYALGWLGPRVRARLDTIRDVRNQFAHHYKIDSFEHSDVAGKCDKLRPDLQMDHWNLSRRQVFIVTALRLASAIMVRALSLTPPPEGPNFEIGQHLIV
jgi:DNA-binding MltR family transcriptional regulator